MNLEVMSGLDQVRKLHDEYHMSRNYVKAVGFDTSEHVECKVTEGSILGMPNI